MDLSTLRRQAAALFRDLALAERDRWILPSGGVDLPSLYAPFSALRSLEAFACAGEELDRAPAEHKSATRAAMSMVLRALEGGRLSKLDAQLQSFDASATVVVQGERLPFRVVQRRLANEPNRELRSRIAQAFEGTLVRLDSTLAHRVEARLELAVQLGFASYDGLLAAASGIDYEALSTEARSTLVATEDAWRDLFDYALRKVVGKHALQPHGEAAWFDLARYSRLEPLDDLFKARRLLPTAQALLEAMGLSADAGECIEVVDEGVQRPGAQAVCIDVPSQIVVILGRVGGAQDFAELLHALGVAHHRAMTSRELPVEQRRFGEEAAPRSFGVLFDQLPCDEGFLRRFLDADARDANEAARLCAIERLSRLRRACAELLYQRTLFSEGPREELRGLYRESLQKALAVDVPVEPWLWDEATGGRPEGALRSFALAEVLRRALQEEANEDWWRNPRAGALLKRVAARGGRDAAETLAKELSGALSLAGAAGRLVQIAAR